MTFDLLNGRSGVDYALTFLTNTNLTTVCQNNFDL